MCSVRSDTEMEYSTVFRFFDLPYELRSMIYSFVVLTPDKKSQSTQRKNTSQDDQHFAERRRCHEAAKSLSLTCKEINFEMISKFWMNKTIRLCTPGNEVTMMHPKTNFFSTIDPKKLGLIRHIEFDLHQTSEDFRSGGARLRSRLILINNYLNIIEVKLPALQTITCKLVDTFTSGQVPDTTSPFRPINKTPPPSDFYFSSEASQRCYLIGQKLPKSSTWEPRRDAFAEAQQFFSESTEFHNWAYGLTRVHLPSQKWALTRSMRKTHARDENEYLVHEARFERWTPASKNEVEEQQRLRREERRKEDDEMDIDDDDEEEEGIFEDEGDGNNKNEDQDMEMFGGEEEHKAEYEARFLESFGGLEEEESLEEFLERIRKEI